MKTRLLALAGLFVLATSAPAADSSSRIWTDKSGRQVQATFGGLEGDMIVLQTSDGHIHRFPLANLSKEDQEQARRLKGGSVNVPINLSVAQAAQKIDGLVNAMLVKKGIAPNPPSTDEQFLRRAYLDIIGRVPTFDEAIGFLIDKSPTKRAKLIDMLLDSPGYGSHLYNYFADMLRVANPDRGGEMSSAQPYIAWLRKSLASNKPYNEMVFDMLAAEGKMWTNGATGYLLRDSGMLLDNLANTFSIFLGTDVACAQCHDHPFAEWTQMQFYQLAAFFGATTTRGGRAARRGGEDAAERLKAELAALNPEAAKKVEGLVDDIVEANRLEVRDIEQNTLRLPKDYKYKDGVGGEPVEPKFITWDKSDRTSDAYKKNKTKKEEKLRQAFAGWLTHPTNPRFGVTIANRLWSRAFGRGVAEPVRNVDDPARSSNPELLVHIGKEMVRLKFNLREFQRILFNTQAWQRAATTDVVPMGADYYFQGPLLRRMTAEQAWDSLVTLVVGDPDRLKNGNTGLLGRVVDIDLEKTTGQVLAQKIEALQQGRQAARSAMTDSIGDVDTAMTLTIDKKVVSYAGMKLLRASELEQPAPRNHFLREFGQSDRQIVDASSRAGSQPQVLMLMNGPVQQMITNPDSLLIRTMLQEELPKKQIEALYLCALSRKPTQAEKTRALEHMNEIGEAPGASNLVWAILNSLEFMFVQ